MECVLVGDFVGVRVDDFWRVEVRELVLEACVVDKDAVEVADFGGFVELNDAL